MTSSMKGVLAGLVVGAALQSFVFAAAEKGDIQGGNPLRFSVAGRAVFTDNRDSVEKDKTSNTDWYISPRVDYVYNDGKDRVDLYYMPSYRYRTKSGDGDSDGWFQDFGLRLDWALSERSRIRFREAYSYDDDSAIVVGGAVKRGNETFGENTAELGYNMDIYKYSNLDFFIRNNVKRFSDDDIAKTSDENITTAEVAHRYRVTETLRTFVAGTVGYYAYDNYLNRDFYSMIAKFGLENSFTENTYGTVVAGYQYANYDDDSLGDNDEPYFKATIETRTGADMSIGASYGHGIRDTDAFPFSSQKYDEFNLYAHMSITPQLTLHGLGIYRMSSYDKEDIPAAMRWYSFKGANGGDDTTVVLDALLDYSILENISVYAGYRYEDVDSEVGQSYKKNSGRVGASYKF